MNEMLNATEMKQVIRAVGPSSAKFVDELEQADDQTVWGFFYRALEVLTAQPGKQSYVGCKIALVELDERGYNIEAQLAAIDVIARVNGLEL